VIPNVQNEGKPIEMIKVETADRLADDQEPIIVTVDRAETYLVGAKELSRDAAVAEVLSLAAANPSQRVLLRADAELRYAPIRELFAALLQRGVANVALAVGVARDAAKAGLVAEQADRGEG
jgi:biopolymer transport protein ExbD